LADETGLTAAPAPLNAFPTPVKSELRVSPTLESGLPPLLAPLELLEPPPNKLPRSPNCASQGHSSDLLEGRRIEPA
jgi:hypothetical protein